MVTVFLRIHRFAGHLPLDRSAGKRQAEMVLRLAFQNRRFIQADRGYRIEKLRFKGRSLIFFHPDRGATVRRPHGPAAKPFARGNDKNPGCGAEPIRHHGFGVDDLVIGVEKIDPDLTARHHRVRFSSPELLLARTVQRENLPLDFLERPVRASVGIDENLTLLLAAGPTVKFRIGLDDPRPIFFGDEKVRI